MLKQPWVLAIRKWEHHFITVYSCSLIYDISTYDIPTYDIPTYDQPKLQPKFP
jgi:hypothetical protein